MKKLLHALLTVMAALALTPLPAAAQNQNSIDVPVTATLKPEGQYSVCVKQDTDIPEVLILDDVNELEEKILNDDEFEMLANGTDINSIIKITKEDYSLSLEVLKSSYIYEQINNYRKHLSMDVSIVNEVENDEYEKSEVNSPIHVNIKRPQTMSAEDARSAKLVHIHDNNGSKELLFVPFIYNEQNDCLSFEVVKFSSYIFYYGTDNVETAEETPAQKPQEEIGEQSQEVYPIPEEALNDPSDKNKKKDKKNTKKKIKKEKAENKKNNSNNTVSNDTYIKNNIEKIVTDPASEPIKQLSGEDVVEKNDAEVEEKGISSLFRGDYETGDSNLTVARIVIIVISILAIIFIAFGNKKKRR